MRIKKIIAETEDGRGIVNNVQTLDNVGRIEITTDAGKFLITPSENGLLFSKQSPSEAISLRPINGNNQIVIS